MIGQAPAAGLAGLRVLVVEDDFLIADGIASLLAERGAVVVGPVGRAARALALVREDAPDVVVLDMALRDGTAAPVADALRARDIPFVIVTGYAELPDPVLRGAPRVNKPFTGGELGDAVARAAAETFPAVAR